MNLSRLLASHVEGAREGADVAPATRSLPQRDEMSGAHGPVQKVSATECLPRGRGAAPENHGKQDPSLGVCVCVCVCACARSRENPWAEHRPAWGTPHLQTAHGSRPSR